MVKMAIPISNLFLKTKFKGFKVISPKKGELDQYAKIEPVKFHIVTNGDSLWIIANKYYSNPSPDNINKIMTSIFITTDLYLPNCMVNRLRIAERSVIFMPERTTRCIRPTALRSAYRVNDFFKGNPNNIPLRRDDCGSGRYPLRTEEKVKGVISK